MVQQGKFRDDLFYRLNVVHMHIPPLRERRDDIVLLAHLFLAASAVQFNKKVKRFSHQALLALDRFTLKRPTKQDYGCGTETFGWYVAARAGREHRCGVPG